MSLYEEKIVMLEGHVDELGDANKELEVEKEMLERKVEEMEAEIVELKRIIE